MAFLFFNFIFKKHQLIIYCSCFWYMLTSGVSNRYISFFVLALILRLFKFILFDSIQVFTWEIKIKLKFIRIFINFKFYQIYIHQIQLNLFFYFKYNQTIYVLNLKTFVDNFLFILAKNILLSFIKYIFRKSNSEIKINVQI